jgi:ribosome-associated protein
LIKSHTFKKLYRRELTEVVDYTLQRNTKLTTIINAEDCLYLNVDDERFQEMNRKIALERLENRILQALIIPKKRKATKPTRASKERKLKQKKIRSEIKKGRSKIF